MSAPVVNSGCSGRFVTGYVLRYFKPAAILQVRRYFSGVETLTTVFSFDAGVQCPAQRIIS
jgi:hypothetical protein